MKKKILKIGSLLIFIMIEEILFSIFTMQNYDATIEKIFFFISISIFLDIIVDLFPKKYNQIMYFGSIVIIGIIYTLYTIFYKLMNSILSINSIYNATFQAGRFSDILLKSIINNWYIIVVFFIPVGILFLLYKKIGFEKLKKKTLIFQTVILIIVYFAALLGIKLSSKEELNSSENLYYNLNNPIENVKHFGLLTTIRLDIQRNIINFKEKPLYQYQDESGKTEIIDMEKYNMLDIDFEKIQNEVINEEIKEIVNYLKSQKPTNKNEYTGRYKGKNLIVFVAESFSNFAINEELTPTLYKMASSGIQFENFYTPLFPVSTADGEYLTDTSLIPVEGIWSMENVTGKCLPYTYGNMFQKKEYKTYAYHNYDYDYYKRDEYFEVTGYQSYLAKGNGLEERMDFTNNPASDYEMVKVTMEDYLEDEHFLAYYVTMSGHMNYDKTNAIVRKNWEKVKDLSYSDKVKSYLATQIELDKALEEVINRLEKSKKLQDTVIIITGDHYPYGLTLEEMQELSKENLDYEFSKAHMPFILYQSEDKEECKIEKYCSSLDVLPTVLNLFGFDYDSRLLMGRDIFSDSEPFVIFSNRSFILKNGRYNATTKRFESFLENTEAIDDGYLEEVKKQIYYKYRYSRLILQNNFYDFLQNLTKL